MKRRLQVANECNRRTIDCTFDLKIAKMALPIRAELSPYYDRIFINYGQFHEECVNYNTFGKYISESEGIQLLA